MQFFAYIASSTLASLIYYYCNDVAYSLMILNFSIPNHDLMSLDLMHLFF